MGAQREFSLRVNTAQTDVLLHGKASEVARLQVCLSEGVVGKVFNAYSTNAGFHCACPIRSSCFGVAQLTGFATNFTESCA